MPCDPWTLLSMLRTNHSSSSAIRLDSRGFDRHLCEFSDRRSRGRCHGNGYKAEEESQQSKFCLKMPKIKPNTIYASLKKKNEMVEFKMKKEE